MLALTRIFFLPAIALPLEAVLAGGVADADVPLGQDGIVVALRLVLVAVLVLPVREVERVAIGVLVFDGPLKVVGVFALPVDVLVRSPGTWVEFDVIRPFTPRLSLMICANNLGCMNLHLLSQYSHKALCI